jgi:hypothetical protein
MDAVQQYGRQIAEVLALANQTGANAMQPTPADLSQHKGRLRTIDSKAKRAQLLATIRQYPAMKDHPAKLAREVGVGESTVRRWLDAEEQAYRGCRAANSPKKK